MRTFVCDRCGYEYAPGEEYRDYILKRQTEKGADYVDLCRFCYFSLVSWVANGKDEHDEHNAKMKKFVNDIIRDNGEPNDFGEAQ